MSFRSFYIIPYSGQILCRVKCMKWSSALKDDTWRNKKVLSSLCDSSIRRIICTDSRLQGALSCPVKSYADRRPPTDTEFYLFLQSSIQKNNVDHKYLCSTSLPSNLSLEDVLYSQEFKDILSRSLFYYDVNLADRDCAKDEFFSKEFGTLIPYTKTINFNSCKHLVEKFDKVYLESSKETEKKTDLNGRASEEQLLHIIDRLTYTLVNFFEKPHDFTIYHKNVIFQNNIKGVRTRGIYAYMQNMYLMRIYGYFHYAKVQVEILKITHHNDDGSVRVRWRVNGLTRQKYLYLCWKLKTTDWSQFKDENTEWLDGFSVFSVGQDGLIYKHVCDKMIPDDEVSASKRSDFRTRLLGLFGLAPRNPAASSLNAMFSCPRQASLSQGIVSYEKLKL